VPTPEQLRAARAAIGMSVDELAAASGVGRSTILRYENRKGQPYAATLHTLKATLEGRGVEFLEHNGLRWNIEPDHDLESPSAE
jgi:transcriptional regulator with XRE-family HTH domain